MLAGDRWWLLGKHDQLLPLGECFSLQGLVNCNHSILQWPEWLRVRFVILAMLDSKIRSHPVLHEKVQVEWGGRWSPFLPMAKVKAKLAYVHSR